MGGHKEASGFGRLEVIVFDEYLEIFFVYEDTRKWVWQLLEEVKG